jgi:hypothetical protein
MVKEKQPLKKLRADALENELNFLVENGQNTVYDLQKNDPYNRTYGAHHNYIRILLKDNLVEHKRTEIGENGKEKYYYGPTFLGVLTYFNRALDKSLSVKAGNIFSPIDSDFYLKIMATWSELSPEVFENFALLLSNDRQLQSMVDALSPDDWDKLSGLFKKTGVSQNKEKWAANIWHGYCFLALKIAIERLIQRIDVRNKRLAIVGELSDVKMINNFNPCLIDEFFGVIFESKSMMDCAAVPGVDCMGEIYKIVLETPVWKKMFLEWLIKKSEEYKAFFVWMSDIDKKYDINVNVDFKTSQPVKSSES